MGTFGRNRIRLALELTKPLAQNAIIDKWSNERARIPHGRAVQFEIGLFDNGVLAVLTSLTALTLEIKSATNDVIDTDAPKLSRTVNSAAFNNGLQADQWENDQGSPSYHAVFEFLDTEIAALDMAGAVNNEKTFGLVITGLTANGRVSCGTGLITLAKDGGTGAGSGVAPLPAYTYSNQEIDAKVAAKLEAGENDDGVGYTLFDKNGSGKGIRFWVEVAAGETEPKLKSVTVERA
jgi:hypothetical protein